MISDSSTHLITGIAMNQSHTLLNASHQRLPPMRSRVTFSFQMDTVIIVSWCSIRMGIFCGSGAIKDPRPKR